MAKMICFSCSKGRTGKFCSRCLVKLVDISKCRKCDREISDEDFRLALQGEYKGCPECGTPIKPKEKD